MSASNHPDLPLAKPEPRRRAKDRERRLERKVIEEVRPLVERRDGHCRLAGKGFGPCDWRSEWAHFNRHRRCFTRGLPPEERHTTAGTFMGCGRHHDDYDEGRLQIDALTERECDGPLRFEKDGHVYAETED